MLVPILQEFRDEKWPSTIKIGAQDQGPGNKDVGELLEKVCGEYRREKCKCTVVQGALWRRVGGVIGPRFQAMIGL